MSVHNTILDRDEMNEQRALWAEVALREFAYEVSGPQALADNTNLDNVATSFLCDLAHLANERGWKMVDLLRVARARYDLETEGIWDQFDGFEQLVVPTYESLSKPVQSARMMRLRMSGRRRNHITHDLNSHVPEVSYRREVRL